MIRILTSDLFASDAQTLVNPGNCVGVMGKGLALAFRRRYPAMYRDYVDRCAGGHRGGAGAPGAAASRVGHHGAGGAGARMRFRSTHLGVGGGCLGCMWVPASSVVNRSGWFRGQCQQMP